MEGKGGVQVLTKAAKQEGKRRRLQEPESDSSDEDGEWSGDSEINSDNEKELDALLADSAPEGTLTVDRSHWKSWTEAAMRLKMSPWRLRKGSTMAQKRKQMRKTATIAWEVYKAMKPRSKKDVAAKPQSAYQVYLGAKRVHERAGYKMPDGTLVVKTMKALTKRFIKKHGFQALIKRRIEPLTAQMIHVFLDLKKGTQVGTIKGKKNSRAWKSWRCMQAVAANAGVRRMRCRQRTGKQGLRRYNTRERHWCSR